MLPVVVIGLYYASRNRVRDLGVLVGLFGGTWSAFEIWSWLNARTDAAVSIPCWSPLPLAAAVAVLLVGRGLVTALDGISVA